jgi:hypothetical protein
VVGDRTRRAGAAREPPGEARPDRRYDPAVVRRGSRGADRIRDGRQGELVLAGAGADRVAADGGSDCVDGGPGRDRLRGGSGDRCRGQPAPRRGVSGERCDFDAG